MSLGLPGRHHRGLARDWPLQATKNPLTKLAQRVSCFYSQRIKNPPTATPHTPVSHTGD
jgi:hypothetical protein